MTDLKVLSTPTMVNNGASVSADFLEYLGWTARHKLIGIWADQNRKLQEEDQVQDEGKDRYLIFGNVKSAVAPFLLNSLNFVDSTLSGSLKLDCLAFI